MKKAKLDNNKKKAGTQTQKDHSSYPSGRASKSKNGKLHTYVASKVALAAALTGMKKYNSVREAYKDVKQKCIGACQHAYHSGRRIYSKITGNAGDQKMNGELTYKEHVERANKKHRSYNLWRSSKRENIKDPIPKDLPRMQNDFQEASLAYYLHETTDWSSSSLKLHPMK